jgi:Gpi18-like mannosyltransferase
MIYQVDNSDSEISVAGAAPILTHSEPVASDRWPKCLDIRMRTVLFVGLAARICLIPLTRGQDFEVWDLASSATLRGVNIYAHHPGYPHGPYAYFPLFLYVELPFRWLAFHSGVSFTILGKIPMLLSDLAVAVLINRTIQSRGRSLRAGAIGAAMFWLNPLVLYNSAYYGRFDSFAIALLMYSLYRVSKAGKLTFVATVFFALAVAAKTFPIFLLFGLWRFGTDARRKVIFVLGGVISALSIPYMGSVVPYVRDIFYNTAKAPQELSWQRIFLHIFGDRAALLFTLLFLVLLVGLAFRLQSLATLETHVLLVLLLFLLCSKVVLEQYLVWPMPWLVLAVFDYRDRRFRITNLGGTNLGGTNLGCTNLGCTNLPRADLRVETRRRGAAAVLLVWFTILGVTTNAHVHLLGSNTEWLAYALAVSIVAFFWVSGFIREAAAAGGLETGISRESPISSSIVADVSLGDYEDTAERERCPV